MSEKKFKSIFVKEFNDLAEIKRAMGFKYETVYASFLRIKKQLNYGAGKGHMKLRQTSARALVI